MSDIFNGVFERAKIAALKKPKFQRDIECGNWTRLRELLRNAKQAELHETMATQSKTEKQD